MRLGDGIVTATSWLLRSLRSSIAQAGWNAVRQPRRRPAACATPCNTALRTETSPLKPPVPGSAGLWLVNALRHRTGTWSPVAPPAFPASSVEGWHLRHQYKCSAHPRFQHLPRTWTLSSLLPSFFSSLLRSLPNE